MGGLLANAPIPIDDAIARPKRAEFGKKPDPQEGKVTRPWVDYLTSLSLAVQSAPARVGSASATAQAASIGATDITNGAIAPGLYRFSYYASIMQADAVSLSLTVTLDWTDGGNAKAFSGAALTTNAVTASQSGTQLIRTDGGSPVRYSTTYVSGGIPSFEYDLSVTLEEVEA